mgnify:CR=1 FL=1
MPKTSRFLIYFIFLLRQFLGHRVKLKWIESRLILAQLESKLVEDIRQHQPLNIARTFAIRDLEKAIKFAAWQIENEFTKEKWLTAVTLIKSRVKRTSKDLTDLYSFAVFMIMGEEYRDEISLMSAKAIEEYANRTAQEIAKLNRELTVDPQIEIIAKETYEMVQRNLETVKANRK